METNLSKQTLNYYSISKDSVSTKLLLMERIDKSAKSALVLAKARFYYKRGIEYFFFVLLIFLLRLELGKILSAERSIKETKNALYQA